MTALSLLDSTALRPSLVGSSSQSTTTNTRHWSDGSRETREIRRWSDEDKEGDYWNANDGRRVTETFRDADGFVDTSIFESGWSGWSNPSFVGGSRYTTEGTRYEDPSGAGRYTEATVRTNWSTDARGGNPTEGTSLSAFVDNYDSNGHSTHGSLNFSWGSTGEDTHADPTDILFDLLYGQNGLNMMLYEYGIKLGLSTWKVENEKGFMLEQPQFGGYSTYDAFTQPALHVGHDCRAGEGVHTN